MARAQQLKIPYCEFTWASILRPYFKRRREVLANPGFRETILKESKLQTEMCSKLKRKELLKRGQQQSLSLHMISLQEIQSNSICRASVNKATTDEKSCRTLTATQARYELPKIKLVREGRQNREKRSMVPINHAERSIVWAADRCGAGKESWHPINQHHLLKLTAHLIPGDHEIEKPLTHICSRSSAWLDGGRFDCVPLGKRELPSLQLQRRKEGRGGGREEGSEEGEERKEEKEIKKEGRKEGSEEGEEKEGRERNKKGRKEGRKEIKKEGRKGVRKGKMKEERKEGEGGREGEREE
ncbi:Cyclic nucleotide-gated cation channel beta-1, partial [Ophiophagus hannah]